MYHCWKKLYQIRKNKRTSEKELSKKIVLQQKNPKIFGSNKIKTYLCNRNKVHHRARAPFVSASDLLMLHLDFLLCSDARSMVD